MREHILTGLDATNPLGFLAALGTLRIADEQVGGQVRLSFREDGRWRPVLHLPTEAPGPVELVMRDLDTWRLPGTSQLVAPELALSYEKVEKKKTKLVRDLKPSPARFRAFLEDALIRLADATSSPSFPLAPGRRLAGFAAAFAAEGGRDGKGNTKPTAFHFTAGQQSFLDMVCAIAEGLNEEHVHEALEGPWHYQSTLPVLRWDVAGERLYALSASDPSGEKATGVPGADWLAFQALPFFPVFARGSRAETTAFAVEGRDAVLVLPLWTGPVRLDVVQSILASAPERLQGGERALLGIAAVFGASVRRTDKGYGNFAAPAPR